MKTTTNLKPSVDGFQIFDFLKWVYNGLCLKSHLDIEFDDLWIYVRFS